MFVSNVHEWAAKCDENPKWVAECLQRIGRFGGQHPTSNVLIHSLEVWWMLRTKDAVTQLWALYHDAHEIMTGDITRPAKNLINQDFELLMDAVLQQILGITYLEDEVSLVDKECGDIECMMWGDVVFAHKPAECVDMFIYLSGFLRKEIACLKNKSLQTEGR